MKFQIHFLLILYLLSFINNLQAQPIHLKQKHFTLEDGLNSLRVKSVIQDADGRMWVGTEVGIQIFDGTKFHPFDEVFDKNIPHQKIGILFKDSNNTIWYVADKSIIKIPYPYDKHQLIPLGNVLEHEISKSEFNEDGYGRIFLSFYNQLFLVKENEISLFFDFNKYRKVGKGPNFKGIKNGKEGGIYIFSGLGIIQIDEDGNEKQFLDFRLKDKSAKKLFLSDNNPFDYSFYNEDGISYLFNDKDFSIDTLPENRITPMYINQPLKNGYNITFSSNIINYYQKDSLLLNYEFQPNGNVRSVYGDEFNNCWITTDNGLYLLSFEKAKFRKIDIASGSARCVVELEDDRLLMVQNKDAYLTTDLLTFKFLQSFKYDPFSIVQTLDGVKAYSFYSVYEFDKSIALKENKASTGFAIPISDSLVMTGMKHRLSVHNVFEDTSELYPILKSNNHVFHRLSDSTFLVGGINGLTLMNLNGDVVKEWNTSTTPRLSHNNVLTIFSRNDSLIYLGTGGGGVDVLNIHLEEINNLSTSDGLSHNVVYSITFDGKDFWFGTQYGLSKYNPTKHQFYNYYKGDGLPHNEFNRYGNYINDKGEIILGTMEGFTMFDPLDFEKDVSNCNIFVSKSLRYNKVDNKYEKIDPFSILENGLEFNPDITHYDLHLGISNYSSNNVQIRYKLEGVNEDWIPLGNSNILTINNTTNGTNKLHIKALLANGAEAKMDHPIIVQATPPFLQSIYFPITIGLILTSIGFAFFKWRMAEQKAQTRKELDKFKTKYYTDITHEFRTPLTIIKGLSNRLPEGKEKGVILRNSDRLLNLVNQMLDLRKLEMGEMETHYISTDIVQYIKYLVANFKMLAKEKDINLRFDSREHELFMDVDREKLDTIMNNLIGNAIKFTNEGGKINVNVKQINHQVSISVSDNGIGISPDKVKRVFDRYYQGQENEKNNTGTGIGLALTKDLVNILKGTIKVHNQHKRGSSFVITLPISKTATKIYESQKQDVVNEIIEKRNKKGSYNDRRPIVLVVEDNHDIRAYIVSSLDTDYQIIEAKNGQIGIDLAKENIPDLILTDVIMPFKDGLELTDDLKNDEKTSHIPIIILTALTEVKERIKGLEYGADDYLGKPFNEEELRLRIKNRLESVNKLREKFVLGNASIGHPIEDAFILKIRGIIENNFTDEHFNVEKLASLSFLSVRQLQRKIKALSAQSPKDWIIEYRMEAAARLLKTTDKSIKIICYQVGHSNVSNFSTAFKKWSGMTPSEYRS